MTPAVASVDPAYRLEIDPVLGESAVLLAIDGGPREVARRFYAQRDALYEIGDPEAREAGFADLNGRWLHELALTAPLEHLLWRDPSVPRGTRRCLVIPAASARKEYADLHDSGRPTGASAKPLLVLRLRPATLLDADALETLLEAELLHVADMLDADFGFQRELRLWQESPALEGLFQRRYRVLWATTVDGRLWRRRRLCEARKEKRRRELGDVFSLSPEEADPVFERFFSGPRPTHRELVAFALAPKTLANPGRRSSGRCPLCSLPTAELHHEPLPAPVLATLRRDFPVWDPASGLCIQCRDLYAARAAG